MNRIIKIALFCFLLFCGVISFGFLPRAPLNIGTLNMSNTISPIITDIAEKQCGYANVQLGEGPGKGGQLIYKREPSPSCVTGVKNAYYIRCYDWDWKGKDLYSTATKDIPLDSYSCIDEKNVEIPYQNKKLQKIKLGETVKL